MSKISKETYDFEINMCRELSQENGGKCNWGECNKCGVLPLLHKLYNNELLEDYSHLKELKKKIFN